MHEQQAGSAGLSVEMPKKTVWYGVGKAVEKGIKALGPDAWRKRVLHIIDTQIIPRSNPKWQEWAKQHRKEIELAAARAGVNITVVEIALASVGVLHSAQKIARLFEKKIPKPELPKVLKLFRAQIHDLDTKVGTTATERLEHTMLVFADSKIASEQKNVWEKIVTLANSGGEAVAFGLLSSLFMKQFSRAGKEFGWGKHVPIQFQKAYAKDLLAVWLELPHVEIFAGKYADKKTDTQSILDAFARIRDYTKRPDVQQIMAKYRKKALLGDAWKDESLPRENVVNVLDAKQSMRDIRRLHRYATTRDNREGRKIRHETSLIDAVPYPLVVPVALDHIRSLSHAEEASLIGNVQEAVDDTILSAKLERKMEGVGSSIADRLKKQFIAHEVRRAKDERERLKARKSAEPYFVVDHDFAKEEQMVADMYAPAKDHLGRTLPHPRDFFYHGDDIGSRNQELQNLALGRSEDTKPADDTLVSSYDEVTSTEPEAVTRQSSTGPETFLESIQRKLIEAAHVRGTKNRIKRIAQAREEYAKNHPA